VVVTGVRPDAIVASLLDSHDQHVSARDWKSLVSEQPTREAKPSVAHRPVPAVKESHNPFKRRAKKLPVEKADTPTAVENELIASPVEPAPVPKVESIAPLYDPEPQPEPPPAPVEPPPVVEKIEIAPQPAASARDLAEQEIVDLILRAQRVSKSTGATLDVCLEELRRHLSAPVVAEAAPKQSRNRRIEFQTSKDGLLTGAKVIEE
jgi:hypothetical protein